MPKTAYSNRYDRGSNTRRLALALGSAAMICSMAMAAEPPTDLTITTYNIHSAVPLGHSNAHYPTSTAELNNIADVVTTAGADIVGLQEVRNAWGSPDPKPGHCPLNMPQYLAGRLRMHYAFGSTLDSVADFPRNRDFPENRGYAEWGSGDLWTNNGRRHGEYGLALLSRLPLKGQPDIIKLPRGTDAEAKKRGDEPRIALRAELKDPLPELGRVVIYVTHLQHNNEKTRFAQVKELIRRASGELKGSPAASDGKSHAAPATNSTATGALTTTTVFLMGDFNHHAQKGPDKFRDIITGAGFHDLAADFAQAKGQQPEKTIGDGDGARIDYIFCSRPVDVSRVTVLQTPVSDHLPVTATIQLKAAR